MSSTSRLALPFLSAGQAQKEITHNEALQTLDFLVAGAVVEPPRSTPPANPAVGDCYIVGLSAAEAWAGWEGALAGYSPGGWRRIEPLAGMRVFIRSTEQWACYGEAGWEFGVLRGSKVMIGGEQVVGERTEPIASPVGGATIDTEARDGIDRILATLRAHGLIAS